MAILKTNNGWLVDIQPGGRTGRRIRKSFLKKEDAILFERLKFVEAEKQGLAISDLTICQLIDAFTNKYARVRFRGFVHEQYRLKVIRSFFEQRNKKIKDFKLADGEAFIQFRKEHLMKINTINRDVNTLKRIFSWAVENELCLYSPLTKLKHLKGGLSRVRWLTEDECGDILDASRQVSAALWEVIMVALNTGFRKSNLAQLKKDDIGSDFITALKTKSGSPYEVPIPENLKTTLLTFPHRYGLFLNTTNLDRLFRKAVKIAGLARAEDDPHKVTLHTLRHTFAAYWLQKGIPIYTVSKWLGHSSVQMTEQIYGHLSKLHHLEEIKKFPGLGVDTWLTPKADTRCKCLTMKCPHGESNPSFGLERTKTGHNDVT